MKLTDKIVARLQAGMQTPDLSGTRYQLVRYLARGGMGSVWLVEDTLLQRQVAFKVLDFVESSDDLPARLLQEARILAGLEHPGIVPVHDAGILADGRAFYCMKYVEGQTLTEHVANKNLNDRLRILERIAEPVDFAHARGFIHRDLKPSNIMIGAFGEVLVMDWGLAKIEGISSPGPALGTPGYMAPEQARGEEVDHRADIFSLGAILRFLWSGSPEKGVTGPVVPRPLRAICDKAMADDPAARYPAARDLTADLAHYLAGEPVSSYRENLLERASRIYNRHSTAVILVAVYLLMRLIFILWARR